MKTMNKKPFIRKIALLLSVLSAVMLFASCGESEGNGKYGKYEVEIKEISIGSYYYTDCVIVVYTFTNNSESNASFLTCFEDEVYQNGVALGNYGGKNYTDYIKPGTTVDVIVNYPLNNTTGDIEIEICADGEDKVILSETYSIPESE